MAITLTAKNVRPMKGALTKPGTAGEEVSLGQCVYLGSDDKWYKAQSNAAATANGRGIVVGVNDKWGGTTAEADHEIDVIQLGYMAGYSDMDETEMVYVDDSTAGALTQTAPSGAGTWTHIIGYPVADNILFVLPRPEKPESNS